MKIYRLEREQWVPRPLASVFDFFSSAENLARLTPPWMGFRIRTPMPIEMKAGAHLDYTIRLAGVSMNWRTRITVWEPPHYFADIQERGPYTSWEHEHTFTERGEGVLVADRVNYALPLGPLGRAVHAVAVRTSLTAIFDYRFQRVRELMGALESDGGSMGQ
jgi:ligand-binding SRPBCC domain-containing protein